MRYRWYTYLAAALLCMAAGGAAVYLLAPLTTGRDASEPGEARRALRSEPLAGFADFREIAARVSPSVVNISVVKEIRRTSRRRNDQLFDYFDDFLGGPYGGGQGSQRARREMSQGSGLIVSPKGYVLTNYHVVSSAERIKVTLYDGRILAGKIVGMDPKTDLAVLKVSADNLPTAPWAASEELVVGQWVLAIGNPFGLSHTVTVGIISAVGRANVGIADYEDFIQTDAAINPGNSGGPLVNAEGMVVGINTAIFSKSGGYQGIGFAVPSSMAKLVMEQLVQGGRVVRGWLGISLQELTPELARKFGYMGGGGQQGSLISDVLAGSPAAEAGLRNGDIIVQYDGHDVSTTAVLRNMVAKSRPGSRVTLKVFRGNTPSIVTAKVVELPAEADNMSMEAGAEGARDAFSGLSVTALTPELAAQLKLEKGAFGVVVDAVAEGSPAAEAGIRRGDIIQEINRHPILTLDDFLKTGSGIRPEDTVLMYVNRGGSRFFVTLLAS